VVGYHESIAGVLDRSELDRLFPPGMPVRVQHRSGGLWMLNSAAMVALGLDERDEPGVDRGRGHLLRRDDLVRGLARLDRDALAGVGACAAAMGVTGFTDATPDGDSLVARALARDVRDAGVAQHLVLMGPVGAATPDVPGAQLGAVKVLLDDHALPSLDHFVATITAAHDERRPVAVHCVTRVQLVLTLAALDAAGPRPGDRIEHGSVIPPELIGDVARLGLIVVTQPHFVAERGDEYLDSVDPDDVGSLYRLRSLRDAGVAVAGGTDAPFGTFDPWASMAAAVERRTRGGHLLGPDERVGRHDAIGLYLGDPMTPGRARTITVGEAADLCVLDRPWSALLATTGRPTVVATLIAGHVAPVTPG
jgi:predicted amidohydrolase YtcJ